jgi:hypothetical protein
MALLGITLLAEMTQALLAPSCGPITERSPERHSS